MFCVFFLILMVSFFLSTFCSVVTDLSACRKIGDDGIIGVSERLTNLTELNVYYCNKITDRGCLAITHNLILLNTLNLADL